MTPRIACEECARLISTKGRTKCEAYPGGIPHEILVGEHDHTTHFKNDRGFRFKPRRKPEPEP